MPTNAERASAARGEDYVIVHNNKKTVPDPCNEQLDNPTISQKIQNKENTVPGSTCYEQSDANIEYVVDNKIESFIHVVSFSEF